ESDLSEVSGGPAVHAELVLVDVRALSPGVHVFAIPAGVVRLEKNVREDHAPVQRESEYRIPCFRLPSYAFHVFLSSRSSSRARVRPCGVRDRPPWPT